MLCAAIFCALLGLSAPGDSLRVPVLVYHNVEPVTAGRRVRNPELSITPDAFTAQMQLLREHGYRTISLADLMDALDGRRTLPERSIVITFDDGRVNQYVNAYPVLRRFGFTATFFPFTHAIGRNPDYFTWAQLREMRAAGMGVGSHTNLHMDVRTLRTAEQWEKEVHAPRRLLQQMLGDSVPFFAYPFGATSPTADSVVQAAGFRAARNFSGGAWHRRGSRWRLNAIPVSANMTLFRAAIGLPRQPAAIVAPAQGR